jgi:uncharacterized Zn finger protein
MWDLGEATHCPGCGKEAVQRIEVRTDEVVVTCMSCGAVRHYTPGGVTIGEAFDEGADRG